LRARRLSFRWDDLDESRQTVLVRDMKNPWQKIGNDVWCHLWQANSYDLQLADLRNQHQSDLDVITRAANARLLADREARQALELRLSTAEQTHHKELTDVQKAQARLRDRLATADLRLSVLLDTTDSTSGCAVRTSTAAGIVVHGAIRARLDPAHAQRIIGITGDGDQGLIALAACQAYVKEVSTPK
jgi:hypothetical protein